LKPEVDGRPNPNRPTTKNELKATYQLDRLVRERREHGGFIHTLHTGIHDIPAYATPGERKQRQVLVDREHETEHHIHHGDEKFRKIVGGSRARAQRAIEKRNKQLAKVEALQEAIDARDARREERTERRDERIEQRQAAREAAAVIGGVALDSTIEMARIAGGTPVRAVRTRRPMEALREELFRARSLGLTTRLGVSLAVRAAIAQYRIDQAARERQRQTETEEDD
ncbi:hypothetical protein KDA23_05460, partial [Candidatus Saccharibacteria bacterium]|nr:hypothetical protein [Candidatus Saccharibacteria bacterium]